MAQFVFPRLLLSEDVMSSLAWVTRSERRAGILLRGQRVECCSIRGAGRSRAAHLRRSRVGRRRAQIFKDDLDHQFPMRRHLLRIREVAAKNVAERMPIGDLSRRMAVMGAMWARSNALSATRIFRYASSSAALYSPS